MLRVIFWILIAANAALFAFHQNLFGSTSQTRREPERAQRQINASQIKLLPASAAQTPVQPMPPKDDVKLVDCIELGDFPADQVRSIEARLAPLNLERNQTRINVEEVSSYVVYIPSLGSKEVADKKVAELQRLGVTNYFVMADNSSQHWGISLGVFKREQAAKNLLADLERKGVTGARITPRSAATGNVLYRLRNLDAPSVEAIDKIMADFPAQQKRKCEQLG